MTLFTWSQTAASNNTADTSINWREGQAPSTVNNSSRAIMAAVAKYRDDMAGIIATGGSSTAYTATSNQGYTANGDGHTIVLEMHTTSGAAPTLNVDARGAVAILTSTGGSAPATGALVSGGIYRFTDNGTNWIVNSVFGAATVPITNLDLIGGTALTAPAIDDTLLIYDLSATTNKRIAVSDFYKTIGLITAETALALDDLFPLYDTSAAVAKAMTPVNMLKLLNLLTEDTAPDSTADFLLSYDTSASTVKKIKPQTIVPVGALVAIIEDQKAQNTTGGNSTTGSDLTRVLNTLVYNRGSVVTLSSNQFTLPAGDWDIEWSAPGYDAQRHQTLLYNFTDTAEVARGTGEQCDTVSTQTRSVGSSRVSIAGSKAFEIRHRFGTGVSNGLGLLNNFGTEVYTRVIIRKG